MADMVNRPPHYTAHPSGVECIQITEHLNFCIGNAVKYLWRAGLKGDALEDLRKARWYVDREIMRLEAAEKPAGAPCDPSDCGCTGEVPSAHQWAPETLLCNWLGGK